MDVTFEIINGLTVGIGHLSKDSEEDIPESAIAVSLFFLRFIIWLGDNDSE